MPFIHIKSLPLKKTIDIPQAIGALARDFAAELEIDLHHVHTTWEFYRPGYYAKGDRPVEIQPEHDHPILVDLLTPDFNDADTIARMLTSIADSIARHIGFPSDNIFINHRRAYAGMVYDEGEIVRW